MGQGILLSAGADIDFMIHGVFSYELFGQTVFLHRGEPGRQARLGCSGDFPEYRGDGCGDA